MDCNEARPLLDASVDRELSSSEARRVQQHLDSCAACRRESEALSAVSRATREAAYYRASDALRARIVESLPPAAAPAPMPEPRRHASRFLSWLSGWRLPPRGEPRAAAFGPAMSLGSLSMLAVTLCALAVGVTLVLHRPAGIDPLADELVASHVRAQLSGRDIDVVSSDQHTVKPWFNGRLDYAPPVEDLAANGFTLTGGRLDYVGHRRVGVLVYRFRKHVIDVYVFPDAGNAAAQPDSTIVSDGYALTRWHDDGMVWCAVTDAAPEALTQFQAALKARLHGGA